MMRNDGKMMGNDGKCGYTVVWTDSTIETHLHPKPWCLFYRHVLCCPDVHVLSTNPMKFHESELLPQNPGWICIAQKIHSPSRIIPPLWSSQLTEIDWIHSRTPAFVPPQSGAPPLQRFKRWRQRGHTAGEGFRDLGSPQSVPQKARHSRWPGKPVVGTNKSAHL